jgi:hypothetical protein
VQSDQVPPHRASSPVYVCVCTRACPASSREVAFHIDHPAESRESSRTHAPTATATVPAAATSTDRTVGRDISQPHTTPKDGDVELSSRPIGGAIGGAPSQSIPGFANDALYGTAHSRAKVEGGAGGGGYYDEKEHKFHEELPKQSFGERLLAGVIRPTNLTAGERPKQGMTVSEATKHATYSYVHLFQLWLTFRAAVFHICESTGVDNFDRMTYEKVSALPDQNHGWWPYFANLPFGWYPYVQTTPSRGATSCT